MSLTKPTVHLNGTPAKMLLEAIEEAYSAVGDAQKKLSNTAPNARDYYVQKDPSAFNKAVEEHGARMQKLVDIRKELEELSEGL